MVIVNAMRITLIYINTCLHLPLMFFIYLITGKSILMDGPISGIGLVFQKIVVVVVIVTEGFGSSQLTPRLMRVKGSSDPGLTGCLNKFTVYFININLEINLLLLYLLIAYVTKEKFSYKLHYAF